MKSRQEKCKDYWFEREMVNTRKNVRDEKEFSRYLETTYRSTLKDIEDDINRFYVKYSTDEGISIAETKKRVKAIDMEEFEAKAKKYVKEKDFTDQANAEMKLYNLGMKLNRLELLKAEINLELINLGSNVEKSVRDKLTEASIQEFERQAGILGKSVTNPRHKAEVIASGSFHNASFDDRIWGNLHIFRSSLETILERSFLKGEHPRKMIPKLKKAFGASTYEANRLAVTEMARVQAEAQMESFKRNGFEQYMFHDTDGSRTCEHCRALDGKVFDVEKMAVGDNAPPLHPHCRCSISAYEDSDEYEKWLDGIASGSKKQWNTFKTEESKATFQQDRYKPIRYGQITRFEAGKVYGANKNGNIEVLPETVKTLYNETEYSFDMARDRYNQDYLYYDRLYDIVHHIIKDEYDLAQEIINKWEKDMIDRAGKKSNYFKYRGTEAYKHEIPKSKPKREPVSLEVELTGKLTDLYFDEWFGKKAPDYFKAAMVSTDYEYEVVKETEKAVQLKIKSKKKKLSNGFTQWVPKSAVHKEYKPRKEKK